MGSLFWLVTYHPHLKNISKIIKKHIKHLYADPDIRYLFTPLPLVPFHSVQTLRSHLVRSKLYPQESKIGSTKSNSSYCLTCNNVNCNSKCLIYWFSCKVCGKQYVGSTTILKSSGTDGTIIRTSNVKQKEEKIIW